MNWFSHLINAVVILLIICPPKYDPAIRWKERNERKRLEREQKNG